jgi:hypothetical protein
MRNVAIMTNAPPGTSGRQAMTVQTLARAKTKYVMLSNAHRDYR